jgi:hypothetical protein
MDALIKTVLDYAGVSATLTPVEITLAEIKTNLWLTPRGSVWPAIGPKGEIKEMTERDTIDTPEDRALSRAIFKKIDELRSRRHLATDEAARRAITDHINVLVKKLNGPEPLLQQEVLALLKGENLTEIPA